MNDWLFLNFGVICKCLKKSTILILRKKKTEQTLIDCIYVDDNDDIHMVSFERLSSFVSI